MTRRTDPHTQAALVAADRGVVDEGLDLEDLDAHRGAAVILGAAFGGFAT